MFLPLIVTLFNILTAQRLDVLATRKKRGWLSVSRLFSQPHIYSAQTSQWVSSRVITVDVQMRLFRGHVVLVIYDQIIGAGFFHISLLIQKRPVGIKTVGMEFLSVIKD